jgi:hypothetical protein
MPGTDPFECGRRIKGNQLATVDLLDADGDLATELGLLGLFVTLFEAAKRFADHLVLGGESTILHGGPHNLLPLFRQMNHHNSFSPLFSSLSKAAGLAKLGRVTPP